MQPRSTRNAVLACVLLGFVLRLAFALCYWTGQPLTHDEREYLALGRSVARGEGFRYPADEPSPGTAQQFGRAPGYPVFLAALGLTTPVDHVPRRVQIAQSALGAIGIWLIALIAGRAAGPRAAVAAAAIAAVYPPLVWIPAYALSEQLYSTLALAAALALAEVGGGRSEVGFRKAWSTRIARQKGSDTPLSVDDPNGRKPFGDRPPPSKLRPPFLAGAVLTGAAILIRPATLFFVPLAAAWIWRRHSVARAVVFAALTILVVAPWTIRNHHVYGRWIAVASEGGVTFWTGNHPLAAGDGDLSTNPRLKRAELAFRAAHAELTPEQLEPLYYRDALAWIRREPRRWAALMARKAFYTVVPIGPSYAVHSARYVAASVAAYGGMLVAALAGARRYRRSGGRSEALLPLWLMAAATVLAGLIFFPQERFRLPVIDPALIATAALLASIERTSAASEPRERSAPAKRRARERAGGFGGAKPPD